MKTPLFNSNLSCLKMFIFMRFQWTSRIKELLVFLTTFVCWLTYISAQATEQIDATSNGDFHNGFTSWNVVNGSSALNPNQCYTGTPGSTNYFNDDFAFISNNSGNSWQYTSANSACFTPYSSAFATRML